MIGDTYYERSEKNRAAIIYFNHFNRKAHHPLDFRFKLSMGVIRIATQIPKWHKT